MALIGHYELRSNFLTQMHPEGENVSRDNAADRSSSLLESDGF